ESSSLSLRTDPSPPVALHLASRPRSYFQLRAGERMPGEDLHLSDLVHSQTHERRRPRRLFIQKRPTWTSAFRKTKPPVANRTSRHRRQIFMRSSKAESLTIRASSSHH